MMTLDALRREPVFRHFYDICQIPHGSGNERALSDHVLAWAQGLGLEVERDAVNNVLVRKAATPGREAAPGVLLQAHLDMVCEKAPGVEHDFARDPIEWVLEGDLLSTGGRTTLGADDGIGVAMAMELLQDDSLEHPALEALFTVAEETDFSGALNFDVGKIRSRFLINLDHAEGDSLLCGSCGGMRVDLCLPLAVEPLPPGFAAYRLAVSGLRGGHSGEDIHRGHGNANVLLARLLMAAERRGVRLASIRGGSFRLAIPRDAEAVVCLNPTEESALREDLATLTEDMRRELAVSGDEVRVTLEREPEAPPAAAELGPVISALVLTPDGIFQMNEMLEGLVDTSDNLGEVRFDGRELRLTLELRSARDSLRTYLYQRMERLAGLLGGSCRCGDLYPGWEFRPRSPLRELCVGAYEALFGAAPRVLTAHAGIEVGCLLQQRPDLDAVAIGPNAWSFHSPSERVSVQSVRRTHQYLRRVLSSVN